MNDMMVENKAAADQSNNSNILALSSLNSNRKSSNRFFDKEIIPEYKFLIEDINLGDLICSINIS
jgi:hypothetical protein